MNETVSLFEAKAYLSELIRRVATTGKGVLLTVRGKLMVRIVPIEQSEAHEDVWEARERAIAEYGLPDYVEPAR